jgi:hypothetical protein
MPVVVQFGKEASQTRDYCVAKNATLRQAQGRLLRAARPDPSLRKERLLGMTMKLRNAQRSRRRRFLLS